MRNNAYVNTYEIVVWSAMLGGLMTLAATSMADVVINRNISSWRGLVFIVLTGTSCVLMTGLLEVLIPDLPTTAVRVLQSSLGPLSGALALTYLGLWLGVAAEDPLVHYTIAWGSYALVLTALLTAALALLDPLEATVRLNVLTALVNSISVALVTVASVRAAMLGDRLARWMVLACLFMAGMVAGLYGHNLRWGKMGLGMSALTAFCTVAYFQIVMGLGIRRNRLNRRLKRLAGFAQGADPATGLPKGSVLLSKVDDAFWRSARIHSECTVVCLHLRNLYELGEVAGHGVDQQILSAMAARIRRAVGFRNVVGLYHPRCFVVVLSAVKQPKLTERVLQRLTYFTNKPLSVVGVDEGHYVFTPHFGIGTVTVIAASADPAAVIDRAERMALRSVSNASSD